MIDIPELIELQDSKVINIALDKHDVIITIETTEDSVACHVCGKQLTKRHGVDQERKLRHLSVLGKRTYVIYKPHRYICEDYDNHPTTTSTPQWHNPESSYTIDYESHVLMELVNSTVVDTSIKADLTEASVTGIVDRHVESSGGWESFTVLDTIGIDEIAMKKGYKDYVTIITSRHEGKIRLLAVLKGKEKATIKAFFKSIPRRLKKTVTAICTDMYDGYINAAKSVFKKQTIIVIDRFHMAKEYRGKLDKYRHKLLQQLREELSHHEYEKLKGAMHILRRNNECLSKNDKVLKRRCYGIFNLKHFFQRLHLDISGYRFLLGNSTC